MPGGFAYHVKHRPASLMGRSNVKEGDLICALPVIRNGAFDRVADLPNPNKIDPLDHLSVPYIQTGDDSFC